MRPFAKRLLTLLIPKRRWLQFRLRTLLLLMTVVAVWLGVQADRARRQSRALRAFGDTSRFVVFDYQMPGRGPWTEEQYDNADMGLGPPGPAWLRGLVGDDYFRAVVGVGHLTHKTIAYARDLPQVGGWVNLDPDVADEDLVYLAGLAKLQGLRLCCNTHNATTDEGLRHLQNLTRLETLDLGDGMTGVGLAYLRQLPNLRHIGLGQTTTPAGLQQAAALPTLESLSLEKCRNLGDDDFRCLSSASRLTCLSIFDVPIHDAGLAQWPTLPHLEYLRLACLSISGAGLDGLRHLPHLKVLDFYHVPITEEGFKHLTGLQELEKLTFNERPLTDAELDSLSRLSRLREMHLGQMNLAEPGLQRLQQALPNVKIYVLPPAISVP